MNTRIININTTRTVVFQSVGRSFSTLSLEVSLPRIRVLAGQIWQCHGCRIRDRHEVIKASLRGNSTSSSIILLALTRMENFSGQPALVLECVISKYRYSSRCVIIKPYPRDRYARYLRALSTLGAVNLYHHRYRGIAFFTVLDSVLFHDSGLVLFYFYFSSSQT